MLIAKITESDFFGGEPQYIDDDARYNTRGVMTDGEGNIAMMKIEDSKYRDNRNSRQGIFKGSNGRNRLPCRAFRLSRMDRGA